MHVSQWCRCYKQGPSKLCSRPSPEFEFPALAYHSSSLVSFSLFSLEFFYFFVSQLVLTEVVDTDWGTENMFFDIVYIMFRCCIVDPRREMEERSICPSYNNKVGCYCCTDFGLKIGIGSAL